jgi:CO/xanthine dehydrogenase Mo-binding subunit
MSNTVSNTHGLGVVGKSVPKLENREKVLGKAEYIADIYPPHMVHGALLASPHAHALILGYDVTEALAAPGVVAVLTGDDVGEGRMGAFIKDEHAIAKHRVRYVGEPVAAVAAETEQQARKAADLIRIEYQTLAPVLTPEQGLAADAPIIHPDLESYFKVFDAGSEANLASRTVFDEGDVASAWEHCDVIVEGEFTTQAQAHVSIEPCGAVAHMDGNGRIKLWSANQSVFRVQANVCESLELPMSRLQSLTPRIGAGFGNKMEPHIQPITVALAMKCGRPVKLILSREEDFEMVRARHPYRIRMKTGAKKDGTLVARSCEVLLDCGAYVDDSPGVLGFSLLMARGPYNIPNMHSEGKLVYTNKIRFGAFRGFGNPQVTFAGEQQIDEIARQLEIDPIDLRRKNILSEGDPWFLGQKVESAGLAQCIDAVEKASEWRDQIRSTKTQIPGRRTGIGMAITAHISGLLSSAAIVRILEDGCVALNTGAVDIGQGSDTVLAQICAETLKVDLKSVSVASPDTDGSPYNWGTTASRVTYMTGRAVKSAAEKAAIKIKQHAAEMFDCNIEDVELRDGGVVGIIGTDKVLPFLAISARAHWAVGGPIIGEHSLAFERDTLDPKRAVALGLPFPRIGVLSFGALVVEVEVDEVTGQTRILKAWSALDVGRAINPQLVEVQIEGAFVQGLGYALFEEMVWDGGRLSNPTLMDYKVPTIADVPYDIESIIIESPEPDGPYGAKGAGEIGINAVPAAIANAVFDATSYRHRHLPMTSERVFNGLYNSQRKYQ